MADRSPKTFTAEKENRLPAPNWIDPGFWYAWGLDFNTNVTGSAIHPGNGHVQTAGQVLWGCEFIDKVRKMFWFGDYVLRGLEWRLQQAGKWVIYFETACGCNKALLHSFSGFPAMRSVCGVSCSSREALQIAHSPFWTGYEVPQAYMRSIYCGNLKCKWEIWNLWMQTMIFIERW